MDATLVATSVQPGEITAQVQALNDRHVKLLRLRALKQQLREVRSELEALESELFGAGFQ